MAQFDVHRLTKGQSLVIDCQSDLLDHIDSRFVVPLLSAEHAPKPITRLNPLFDLNGEEFVMLTQSAAAVRRSDLEPVIASLSDHRDIIIGAIDVLLAGV